METFRIACRHTRSVLEGDKTLLPVKSTDIVTRRIGEEMVLVPIRKRVGDMEHIFTLNGVGARIWELWDGVRTPDAIAAVLAAEFDVDAPTAASDVHAFIDDLVAAAILIPPDSV